MFQGRGNLLAAFGIAGATALGIAACDQVLGSAGSELVSGAACPEFGNGNAIGVSFSGKAELDAQIGAFVQASADLRSATAKFKTNIAQSCIAIGKDLGMPDDQLAPGDDGVTKPCQAVSAEIEATLAAAGDFQLAYTPPKCQADASFEAKCNGECGVEVDPGKIVAECEPARLSGHCKGECRGECSGICEGECQGECTAKDAEGRCVGECKGTCKGSCDATCHAECEGEWEAPRCEVDAQAPKAKAECQASCEASADVRASCTPPRVTATTAASDMKVQKLKLSLQRNLPKLLEAQWRLSKEIGADLKVVVQTGNRLRGEMQGAGAKAVACVSAAVNGVVEASASVNVSVQASASVSGSVNAQASANASASAG